MLRLLPAARRVPVRWFSAGWWNDDDSKKSESEKPSSENSNDAEASNAKVADEKSDKWSVFDDPIDIPSVPIATPVEPPPRRSALFTHAPRKRDPVVEGTPVLSLSAALFLAKEAGVFTTRELQTHLVKSPSFSTDRQAPFLLEDFFTEVIQDDPFAVSMAGKAPQSGLTEVSTDESSRETEFFTAPASVHAVFASLSKMGPIASFEARGREWLSRAEGRGTRKRATAHVILQRGTGIVKVNGEEDFYKRWPLLSNRFDVLYPFEATGAAGLFDVFIHVKGGGISGQAGAARLAVGRALVAANPLCEDDLRDTLVLHEDTRQKTSKFPGKKGAYARRNWTLR